MQYNTSKAFIFKQLDYSNQFTVNADDTKVSIDRHKLGWMKAYIVKTKPMILPRVSQFDTHTHVYNSSALFGMLCKGTIVRKIEFIYIYGS